jgi:hypothetical protein
VRQVSGKRLFGPPFSTIRSPFLPQSATVFAGAGVFWTCPCRDTGNGLPAMSQFRRNGWDSPYAKSVEGAITGQVIIVG